jgi:heptosyltransferase-2
MQKVLVIQTAFIGDVVLATGLLEKLNQYFPSSQIDLLVRKGNESLFHEHPFLHEVLVWDKRSHKYRNLLAVSRQIQKNQYELLINLQRFTATGLLTVFSGAKQKIGFDKNPLSAFFTTRIGHVVKDEGNALHEIERNHELIRALTDDTAARPKLYPTIADKQFVEAWQQKKYICIAPASVWFTKQFPSDQWVELIDALPNDMHIHLLGAPGDADMCELMRISSSHPSVFNLAGKLSFLQSAALQQGAVMNYVNDSAPMHFASAVNAPVTAVYCSTIPAFGFGPLSDNSHIVETMQALACRPCGLHGRKACPLGNFNCARTIQTKQLLATLP